ncbi:MAG: N-acetylmuramoyl-L-alanine amidase, partial [Stackebrandtia sp.]
VAAGAAALLAASLAAAGPTNPAAASPPADRQAEFAAAAAEFGVPESVLLGVSYMESRWRDHAGEHSVSGGYGPMHLTDVAFATEEGGHGHGAEDRRGDAARPMDVAESTSPAPVDEASLQTLDAASELTGADAETLKTDPAENIRGGAALLAGYAERLGAGGDDPADWYGAVARYSGAADEASAARFADEVYAVLDSGAEAETDDGAVSLPAVSAAPRREQLSELGLREAGGGKTDCPKSLGCEWIPAPYEQYGPEPGDYGNHDQADRPDDMDVDYIVIHDTETPYDDTIDLVQDPEYVSWQYTLRSSDGHVAQHVKPEDVAWHAGNWSVNMRSIGLEHEGYAADGSWYTEAMYRSSAHLVRYLTDRFDIPLDREHIIGHDNVPGVSPDKIADMHWDPGPYWDWSHYFDLLEAPLEPAKRPTGIVQVAPDYETNRPEMIGCDADKPEEPCPSRPSSTVFLYSEPDFESDLLVDVGIDPEGDPATNRVNDLGSRAGTGEKFAVADVSGEWTAVWYLGQKGWIYNPSDAPSLIPVKADTAVVLSKDTPVYGVAYPEDAAYDGTGVPAQEIVPLPYTLDVGQRYVIGQELRSQYYWAKEFEEPGILVEGERRYFQIQLGNRVMYVDVDDVLQL